MLYTIDYTSSFKKNYKQIVKQNKNLSKLHLIIEKLANGEKLESCNRNHKLINNRKFKNCWECHIEPNWLLVYQYDHTNLILLLVNTGSNNEILDK